MPLLEGEDTQRLLDGDHVALTTATTTAKAAMPEISHRVEPFEDGGEQEGVRLVPGGVVQHVLTLPSALDGWIQFVDWWMALACPQSFEFAVHGA